VGSPLEELLTRHVAAGTVPGAVGLLDTGEAEPVAVGASSVGGPSLRPDAIVRIQSMTKVITAVATLRLVEAGRLSLDDSVETWLPELAGRRVLRSPDAELDDTVPAERPITVRHLLTCTSGYGMAVQETPLARAMRANGTEAGPEPVALGAGEWLERLAGLPLAFQPGEGWRYHHSFAVLGILLARVTGRPLQDHLREDLLEPLGMVDTGFWVPEEKRDRLPAAYRADGEGLLETEPAAGGFYVGPPPFDIDHGELVSTVADFARFARMLAGDGRHEGSRVVSAEHVRVLHSDRVPVGCKTPDSFFPGFWDGVGWGFGVSVQLTGPRAGRYGWGGGAGTEFFVDPDGTVGILFTQVELGQRTARLFEEFQALRDGDGPG
jgi:CubicO group peptidase (beta-lactamase class C family)